MQTPKDAVYLNEQIQLCEQYALQHLQLSVDELMAQAGAASFSTLCKEFPHVKNIVIFCGSGNNAGDGLVLAKLAHQHGYVVTVNLLKEIEVLSDEARHAALQAIASGVTCLFGDDLLDHNENLLADADLLIDAIIGIGLYDNIREPYATVINQINYSNIPVMAIDIPSGLNSDTGKIMGYCIRAAITVTFIGKKFGMMTADGVDVCGRIILHTLNLSEYLGAPAAMLLSNTMKNYRLPRRLANCYKNQFGHILIIGGNIGMPGSVCLAAEAALRVGAGLVTIVTQSCYAGYATLRLPEAMIFGIENAIEIQCLLEQATVCLIGTGLGTDDWAQQLFNIVIASHLPMVIDASALQILAVHPQYDDNWVLTPHPGEAAHLLACSITVIQNDRYLAVQRLQQQYGGTIVLKGVGSLICHDSIALCDAGNPGMASPGMGDVLSGVIAGLIAQGLSLAQATNFGVYIHSKAADLAAEEFGQRGLLATDLFQYLRQLVNAV